MSQLTFKSQNLAVDWISFKFQYLDNFTMMQIANYFFKIGFNSYQESGKLAKPIKEPILVNSRNRFQVLFVIGGPHWDGTIVQFSGRNGAYFYKLIQEKLIHWKIFSSGVLSRLDLCYSRNNKTNDDISVLDFLENCRTELKQMNKNYSLQKNSQGLVLKLGSRRSNNFSRIYETKNSLRFEHEMKGRFIQDSHDLLVFNNLEELEHNLSSHFFSYLAKLLPLKYCFTDWLVRKLRPIRKQRISQQHLNVDYIQTNAFHSFTDRKHFFNLLQFLVYAQELDFTIDSLGTTPYRRVVFRLQDFLKYQNPTVKSTNYYQLKKLYQFFYQLQANSFIKVFTDTNYRSLVTIPEVRLEKSKRNSWVAQVWLAEELFHYAYPFLLPDLFKNKLARDQFEVQFHVIQVFSSEDIKKKFFIQEFLDSYPSAISNQQKTKIKQTFLQSVQVLEQLDLVESHYQIISNGSFHHTKQLNTDNISEGFVLHEKISI